MEKKSIIPFSFLCGVPLIMVLGNSMLIPVLPKMKEALDISQFQVSLIISLFSIPAGLTIPFAGVLSDRISRKLIIAVALLVYGLGGLVAGGAAIFLGKSAYSVIMGGRILQGIGAAGTAPIAMALTGDIFTSNERSKVLGLLEASNGLGKVTSPILGSIIGLIAWWAVFFLFPVLCIPIALGIWFTVKEPQVKKKGQPFKQYVQALKGIFKAKGVSLAAAFLAGSSVLFVLFGVLFYLSDHLETEYGIEGVIKGLVIAIPVLAMASTSYITGLITQKRSSLLKTLVVAGTGLLAISLVLVPFFQDNTYVLVGALVLAGIGTGAVLPCLNTLITSSCNTDERGIITSLYGGVRFFGVAGGPPVFGYLMDKSTFWTFVVPAILAGAVAVINLLFLKSNVLKQNNSKDQESKGNSLGQENSKEGKKKPLVSLKLGPQPGQRPLLKYDIETHIIDKSLEKLKPRIEQVVQKEVETELGHLSEKLSRQLEDTLRQSIKVSIENRDSDEKNAVKDSEEDTEKEKK